MKKHILVVDDDPAIRVSLSLVLKRVEYCVTSAKDGREALGLILSAQKEKRPFNLLITDIQMPKMSGIELIHEIRMYHLTLPVLVVSGVQEESVKDELQEAGCSGFFPKPFDFIELVERVGILTRDANPEEDALYSRLVSRRVV